MPPREGERREMEIPSCLFFYDISIHPFFVFLFRTFSAVYLNTPCSINLVTIRLIITGGTHIPHIYGTLSPQ